MERLGGGEDPAKDSGRSDADRIVLVVCPTHRAHRELPLLSPPDIKYLFHDYASTSLEDLICNLGGAEALAADPLDEIDCILAKVAGVKIAAVISTDDYPGCSLAAVIAERLGLPGPSPEVILICQHKYLSRVAQAKLAPEAVPPFAPIDVAAGAALPRDLRFRSSSSRSSRSSRSAPNGSTPHRNSPRCCRDGSISTSSFYRSIVCSSAMPARKSAPSG